MTFYQELQLSSAGSKQLIKNTQDSKEKRRHIFIYNFKVYLVMIFTFTEAVSMVLSFVKPLPTALLLTVQCLMMMAQHLDWRLDNELQGNGAAHCLE